MTQLEAVKAARSIIAKSWSAITRNDDSKCRKLIDVLDYKFEEVKEALPTFKSRSLMWSQALDRIRRELRECIENN